MNQEEIDALLKDSMFQDSSLQEQHPQRPSNKQEEESGRYGDEAFESYEQSRPKQERVLEQSDNYGNEDFQSYEESRKTFSKKASKKNPIPKHPEATRNKLEDIKQEASPQIRTNGSRDKKSAEKPKSKTGIYFYPPKQSGNTLPDKKPLPYNYTRLQERQKQLLLTTLSEENRQLKEETRRKELEFKKLENAYKVLLQEKSQQAASVRQATLEKQLAALQAKFDKFQNLYKLERERNQFKTHSKRPQTFVTEELASQKEQEYLELIDQLKERLIASNTQLKTLQAKMNDGENYIEELKRKMKRVEQLEFKMQKMAEQAENDREYIHQLKENNSKLESQLFEAHKEKRLLEVEVRRCNLGQATQADTLSELVEVRKEKEMLERTLRELAGNLGSISKRGGGKEWGGIEDSGELLRP